MRSFVADHFRPLVGIIVATALLTALTTTIATSQVIQVIAAGEGGAGRGVQVKSENTSTQTLSTTPVNLPGGFINFTVRSGETWLILARWTGVTTCYGASYNLCNARILLDGVDMNPSQCCPYIHGTSGNVAEYHGHSMERFRDGVPAGNHTLQVQYWVSNSPTTLAVQAWTLSVQAWRSI